MYWNEKLDIIKKKYPAPAFRDMFRIGGEVIEKIIRKFHNATYMTFTQSDCPESLLKEGYTVREVGILELERKLYDLEEEVNYWLFLLAVPMGNPFQVYDCRKAPLLELFYWVSGNEDVRFYIADKKYAWIWFVRLNNKENTAYVYEIGSKE